MNISRWFRRIFLSDSKLEEQLTQVENSGYFDLDHYLSQAGKQFASTKDAIEHYFHTGVSLGLNPGPGFNTSWYLQTNSDITQAGINPLFHYIKFGQFEGRSPVLDVHAADGFSSPNVCIEKAWAGFPNLALPKLHRLAENGTQGQRVQALWHLACWYHVHGEPAFTLELLENLQAIQKVLSKKDLVARSKCIQAAGRAAEINQLLNLEKAKGLLGNDLAYLRCNAIEILSRAEKEAAWLDQINPVFCTQGLAGLVKSDPDCPLSLHNLSADVRTESRKSEKIPRISVIVPACNAANSIHIALNSLVAQNWPDVEIIVVDDASTDDTATVVQAFCERYENVKYLRNPENRGAYPTRNRGYEQATGEFITVHDSDDWSHPQKLEQQVTALINNENLVCTLTNWVRVNDRLQFIGPWQLCEEFVEKNHSSAMIRRSVIENIGKWDEVNVAADTEFLWRLEKVYGHQAISVVMPEVPFSFALVQDASLTQRKATHVKTVYYGLRRLYREAAAWWHETGDVLFMEPGERKFPCPLGNMRDAPNEFELVLAADFSSGNERLEDLLGEVRKRSENHRMALFHWPDYRQLEDRPVAPQTFELCMELGLNFTHAGHELTADQFCLFDSGLAIWPPDELPRIQGLQEVHIIGPAGQIDEVEEALREKLSVCARA